MSDLTDYNSGLTTYLRFMVTSLWMSVSVSVSIECTPGARARKSILTDWHVEGRSGLSTVVRLYSQG